MVYSRPEPRRSFSEKDETLRAARLRRNLQLGYLLQLNQNSLAMERLAIEEKIADIQGRNELRTFLHSSIKSWPLLNDDLQDLSLRTSKQICNLSSRSDMKYCSVNQQIEVQTEREEQRRSCYASCDKTAGLFYETRRLFTKRCCHRSLPQNKHSSSSTKHCRCRGSCKRFCRRTYQWFAGNRRRNEICRGSVCGHAEGHC